MTTEARKLAEQHRINATMARRIHSQRKHIGRLREALREAREKAEALKAGGAGQYNDCDGWTITFNSFSAGQHWGRQNPAATAEEADAKITEHANAIFPHDCGDTRLGEPGTHPTFLASDARQKVAHLAQQAIERGGGVDGVRHEEALRDILEIVKGR